MTKNLQCIDYCGFGPTCENADSDLILEKDDFPGKEDERAYLPENDY